MFESCRARQEFPSHHEGAGSELDLPNLGNRAFRSQGAIVPEPASALLLPTGFTALAPRGLRLS